MKFEEAFKLMREGKKMTTGDYLKGNYFYIGDCGNLKFYDSTTKKVVDGAYCLGSNIFTSDWYEYKKYKNSILDEAEKKYLENVLRPFRKMVVSIRKGFIYYKQCYCLIVEFKSGEQFYFPNFNSQSNMYVNMKTNKSYTLKDLGLFEKER